MYELFAFIHLEFNNMILLLRVSFKNKLQIAMKTDYSSILFRKLIHCNQNRPAISRLQQRMILIRLFRDKNKFHEISQNFRSN